MVASDENYMDLALEAAAAAGRAGDVPIGAVLVHEGEVIAVAGNRREQDCDPTAHAEILALRAGGSRLHSWRLNECTLYVTLEPCPMCMGAVINGRVGRLVFATRDPKAGAAVSCYHLGTDELLNHRVVITEGVRTWEASEMLSRFFASLRAGSREVWVPDSV
jgi:tRNA(adenine34) deaminase